MELGTGDFDVGFQPFGAALAVEDHPLQAGETVALETALQIRPVQRTHVVEDGRGELRVGAFGVEVSQVHDVVHGQSELDGPELGSSELGDDRGYPT